MGRLRDLTGEMFGRLKVIKRVDNIGKEVAWLCNCQCEKQTPVIVKSRYLVHGVKQSCGCIREEIIDLTGLKFNHWRVISYVGKSKSRNSLWLCECDCNEKSKSIVTDNNLKQGTSRSCGCQNPRNKTHDKSRNGNKLELKIYKAWSSMKNRCYNENAQSYNHYGNRGIRVCDKWLDVDSGFMNFYNWSINNGVDTDLTLDRIDVNGNYEPNNCRWVDYKVQNNNKTVNRLITYNGKTKTLTLWAEEIGMSPQALKARLDRGWDVNRAFTESIRGV